MKILMRRDWLRFDKREIKIRGWLLLGFGRWGIILAKTLPVEPDGYEEAKLR